MSRKRHQHSAGEQATAEACEHQPPVEWKQLRQKTIHAFADRGYWPNLVITIVGLLVAPAIGVIVKSPKVIIYSLAAGVTVLIWAVALVAARQLDKTDRQVDNKATINTPPHGNLKARTIALSDEIVQELRGQGWGLPSKPRKSSKEAVDDQKFTSIVFCNRYLPRLTRVREEFAELHIRDDRLEEFFARMARGREMQRISAGTPVPYSFESSLLPTEIEDVAKRLKALANEIQ